MPSITAETIWNQTEAEFKAFLDSGSLKPQSDKVRFYAPSFTYYKSKHYCSSIREFPTISVTGNSCALNCRHCGGKVLETMYPATTPTALFELGQKLKADGAKGLLISGGCMPNGHVPLLDFEATLRRFKQELGLTVFVHTGIVETETAESLKQAKVDAALIDVLGSDSTIKKILNLNVTANDYAESLQALAKTELPIIPHVIVGLNNGELDGELAALQTIKQTIQPSALVIIAFMPIHGTQMANTPPPKPLDIARVTASARTTFPTTPIALGCMRPKGRPRQETDIYALKAGVDAIAFPSDAAVEYAKSRGYRVAFSSYCCAQMYLDSTK
jgi:lipoyl synthase